MPIQVDRIAADIRAIAACTHTPGNGATRPTFSTEWARARDYVIAEGNKIGCETRIDAAGNVFMKPARLRAEDLPPIRTWLCGSHIDTVPNGGDYDGVAGIVVALELLRSAHEENILLPLELVIFAEEEGPTFGLGMLGSRALVGELDAQKLGELKNKEGQTYLEAGAPYGVKPEEIAASRLMPERHHGLIELHIEQGPAMWEEQRSLSIVNAIAGRLQYKAKFIGQPNHAGSTPMNYRRDALVAAARVIVGIERMAIQYGSPTVATVGRIDCEPNAINVIPGIVRFTVDVRSADAVVLNRFHDELNQLVIETGATECNFFNTEDQPPVPMSSRLVEALSRAAETAGKPNTSPSVSGALHDSAVLAPHLPTVMLFVPSKGGISHNPAEFSRVEDIAEGAKVIEQLVRRPTLDLVNTMDTNAFVAVAGRFYEHSPWIAERAHAVGPFASVAELSSKMSDVVRRSSTDEQLELIRAHPDLVGKLARENKLTSESTSEQKAAGLTQLSPADIELFEKYNAAYKAKFGFPFIICARQNKKDAILAAFPKRLVNAIEAEIETALAEIDKIALLRMQDAIWE